MYINKKDNSPGYLFLTFVGYLAIFSNHCLVQYGLHKAQSPNSPMQSVCFICRSKPAAIKPINS
jgi:hypothetical protein